MRRNHALASLAAGALLLACFRADWPRGVHLGDDLLASITGLDPNTIGAQQNCVANSLAKGQIAAGNCPDPAVAGANPARCVNCPDGAYNTGGDLGTGEGGWIKSSPFDCSEGGKDVGGCDVNGTCTFMVPDGSCSNPASGAPTAYQPQYSQSG